MRIEFDATGIVDTMCSCPSDHGGICKHRVAVLLMHVRDADEINQRPPVSELVAKADPELLRGLLVDLAETQPELADRVKYYRKYKLRPILEEFSRITETKGER